MLLLACWLALLWRLSEQPALTVDVVFDGRNYDELQAVTGLLARVLPIDARFLPDTRFRELVSASRRAAGEAGDWQDGFVPELHRAGDPPSIGFEYEEWPAGITSAGLAATLHRRAVAIHPFKLKLTALRAGERLSLAFDYDPARFAPGDIARLAGQYQALCAAALDAPAAPLSALSILSDAERRQLLVDFNQTQTSLPPEPYVHALFERQAERTPEHVAVAWNEQRLTYRDLDTRANQLAQYLRGLGIGPESRIGLCMTRVSELMVGLLGVLKAGSAFVPLDPSYPLQRLAFMLDDARPSALLTQQHLLAGLPAPAMPVICLDRDWPSVARHDGQRPPREMQPDHAAYVIYTSGSTGKPKGVVVTHVGLANYLLWCVSHYPVTEGDGTPVHSSLAFDLTITSRFAPLLAGRSVTLLAEDAGIEPLGAALRRPGNFGMVKLTPAHLEILSRWLPANEAATATRSLVIGGEKRRARHQQQAASKGESA